MSATDTGSAEPAEPAAPPAPTPAQQPDTTTAGLGARAGQRAPGSHRWRTPWPMLLAAGLAMAWSLPLVTGALGADAVLPVAIWVAVASVLRSGRTLLDRLLLALALLIGVATAAGVVLSVWPWGLAPYPTTGAALSATVLLAAVLRRRPQLPWRARGSDLAVLGVGGLAVLTVGLPWFGAGRAERFSLQLLGEDVARHFTLYDTIGLLDGYAFLHRASSQSHLLDGMQTYPQGSHFLYALLDRFLVSSGIPDAMPIPALASFDHYAGFQIAGYGFFALAVMWAARWGAGPALKGLPAAVVPTVIAAAVTAGDLVVMHVRGYPAEVMGLALFAILLALCARPLPRAREQVAITGALLVGVSWAYLFLLPAAGLVCVAAVIGHWPRARRHWLAYSVTATLAGTLALFPYAIRYYSDLAASAEALLPGGPAQSVDRGLTAGLAAILLAGVASAPRSPVRRMAGVQLAIVGGVAAAVGGYQLTRSGELAYYFDKAVHALLVTCLVSLAAIAPLLAGLANRRRDHSAGAAGQRQPSRAGRLMAPALAALGIAAAYGVLPLHAPAASDVAPARQVSWGLAYASGELRNPQLGAVTAEVIRRYPTADGRLTQVVFDSRAASYLASLFVAVTHRNQGAQHRERVSAPALVRLHGLHVTIAAIETPQRIIVVNNPRAANQVRAAIDNHPKVDIELVSIRIDLSGL